MKRAREMTGYMDGDMNTSVCLKSSKNQQSGENSLIQHLTNIVTGVKKIIDATKNKTKQKQKNVAA